MARLSEPTKDDVRIAMRAGYDRLISFVTSPSFQKLLIELFGLPRQLRPQFVRDVLLSKKLLAERGVILPKGILLVRSSFGDRRPTLFCVKTYLPKHLWKPWQNVNITFDENYEDEDVPRDGRAWRIGLGFEEQAALMSSELSYRDIVDLP